MHVRFSVATQNCIITIRDWVLAHGPNTTINDWNWNKRKQKKWMATRTSASPAKINNVAPTASRTLERKIKYKNRACIKHFRADFFEWNNYLNGMQMDFKIFLIKIIRFHDGYGAVWWRSRIFHSISSDMRFARRSIARKLYFIIAIRCNIFCIKIHK